MSTLTSKHAAWCASPRHGHRACESKHILINTASSRLETFLVRGSTGPALLVIENYSRLPEYEGGPPDQDPYLVRCDLDSAQALHRAMALLVRRGREVTR